MANYDTGQDLVRDILFRGGETLTGTSDFGDEAVKLLNRAYQAICSGGSEIDPDCNEHWTWLRKSTPGVLILEPSREGQATVANNSSLATLTAIVADSLIDWHIKFADDSEWYRIQAHDAGTDLITLDSVYTAGAGTKEYLVVKLEYALASDVDLLISPMKAYKDARSQIDGVSMQQLEGDWPLWSLGQGVPRAFALAGPQRVRFSHYPGPEDTDRIRIEYNYHVLPTPLINDSTSIPLVPRQHRKLLADVALMYLYMEKNDTRYGDLLAVSRTGLRGMMNESKRSRIVYSPGFGRIYARQSDRHSLDGPLRTESGLIIG